MLFPVFQWRDQCQCHQQNLQVFTSSEQLSILWLLAQYIFPCPISKTGIITSASTHQLTNAPLSIGSWLLNSTRYTDRQTPGKTYTHLSHLSVFPSYEGKKHTKSPVNWKKNPNIIWSCHSCRNIMFKLSESLPTNSIKVFHLTNKTVGGAAFLGSEKVYWENEKYPFSKILQDFGKVLWKLTIHLPSKLLYVKQGNKEKNQKHCEY